MQDIQSVYAWREAIELSKDLIKICEEFSDAEKNVLVWHLRQAVVEIPATIAADIKLGRKATMEPVIKLATELELVHRVYPAIDTDGTPAKLATLIERMESENFNERQPQDTVWDDSQLSEPVEAPSEPAPPREPRMLSIQTEDTQTDSTHQE